MSIDWDKVFGVRPSISADPEVLRVLYERLKQRNAESKAQLERNRIDMEILGCQPSYYNDESWRDQITVADAQWLHSLQISPL